MTTTIIAHVKWSLQVLFRFLFFIPAADMPVKVKWKTVCAAVLVLAVQLATGMFVQRHCNHLYPKPDEVRRITKFHNNFVLFFLYLLYTATLVIIAVTDLNMHSLKSYRLQDSVGNYGLYYVLFLGLLQVFWLSPESYV